MEPFSIDPETASLFDDLSSEELDNLAKSLQEQLETGTSDDEQIELCIYVHFLAFKKTDSAEHLELATLQTEGWIAELSHDHPDRSRRFQILDALLACEIQRGPASERNIARDIARNFMQGLMQYITQGATHDAGNREVDQKHAAAAELAGNYQRTGNLETLEAAIRVMSQSLDLAGEHTTPRMLSNFAAMLGLQFERTGHIDDINRAVEVADMAVAATPHNHPDRADYLINLGGLLGRRFNRTGSMDDLNRGVEVVDMAVDTTPRDHPDRAGYLINLGNGLGTRFQQTGFMDDLNRAVEVADMAVVITPHDHPDRAGYLKSLGRWLSTRFDRTGSMDDLNRAVEVADMAVAITPHDHPDHADYLNNLGNQLGKRCERTGSIDDINRAVEAVDMAVVITPHDHPDRASYLNDLGNQLGRRFDRTGSMDDINRAVEAADMAVVITPHDHPDRAGYLNNLGNQLGRRFDRTDSMDDINRAVEVGDMAVPATPQDHPNRTATLNNLGSQLGIRFDRTGSMDDLNRAVEVADMAVAATPQDHPDRAAVLHNLGNRLGTRFDRTSSMDDMNRMLLSYKEGYQCEAASPSIRLDLGQKAAHILASQGAWEASSSLLEETIKLLPLASPRSLKHTDKQSKLSKFAGLASMTAAVSLNAGRDAYHALRLLELSRGVIASLLMDMRGDISVLKEQHPDLAQKFISLRDALDSPVDTTISPTLIDKNSSWELKVKQRYEMDQEFNNLISTIRDKPGFDNFLLPPTEAEMKNAARFGPIVVISGSDHRCDAFLVKPDQITLLELFGPEIPHKKSSDQKSPNSESLGSELEEVQNQVRELRLSPTDSLPMVPTLEWLWDHICRPCLDALGFKDPIVDDNWPHVWWISTGWLGQLPFHAAGYHGRGANETVLDRVMSSYASSIKALIHGRRNPVRSSAGPKVNHALLVAMKETPNLSQGQTLPSVEAEINMLHQLCPSLQLKPIMPIPRKYDILKHLQQCTIFHFAGHGTSHPTEPSESHLLLEDWETNPLTVGEIRDCKLQEDPPFLAYLSACLTGTNEVRKLVDEGVHLVSAF
ncbi:hypothetical protein TWF694_006073 [Orbilia ellipsospora]|uniref:CHAT domain-containing protein n=1 Tax=Orbilia ellipsospora TaxID=2528407 RepID=A0AAV9WRC3_9PEZI